MSEQANTPTETTSELSAAGANTGTTVTVALAWISAALDEIWELRELCAYEAAVREADLDYATYPKTRRSVAQERIERLREAARGHADVAVAGTSSLSLRAAMRKAGAAETLTRSRWESEKPQLREDGPA